MNLRVSSVILCFWGIFCLLFGCRYFLVFFDKLVIYIFLYFILLGNKFVLEFLIDNLFEICFKIGEKVIDFILVIL